MTSEEHYDIQKILEGNPFQIRPSLQKYMETVVIQDPQTEEEKEEEVKRTSNQNRALWKFFQLVADELTKNGVTMRMVFEKTKSFDIPPSKDNVHDLWIYFQKALYKTERTRDLKKRGQIDRIHEVLMKNLGELFHIDYISFPHEEKPETPAGASVIRNTSVPYPDDYQEPHFP